MIKKLFLLSLLTTSIHSLQAALADENLKSKDMEAPLQWNPEAQEKKKDDRLELQKRPSFAALKELRESYGRQRRDSRSELYTDMRDIQKPGDASNQMREDMKNVINNKQNFMNAQKEASNPDEFLHDPAYQELAKLRTERRDFNLDAKNPTARLDDVRTKADSAKILADQLRGADKYIAYLQEELNDLRKENADLKNKLNSSLDLRNGSNSDDFEPLTRSSSSQNLTSGMPSTSGSLPSTDDLSPTKMPTSDARLSAPSQDAANSSSAMNQKLGR